MKSSTARSAALATKPATLMREEAPNTMPFGFTRNTRPLASMAPKIWLGFWSKIRFKAIEDASGWVNRTSSFAPTLNDCQSMARRSEVWLTRVLGPS